MKPTIPFALPATACLLGAIQLTFANSPILKVNTPALNTTKELIIIGSAEDTAETDVKAAGVAEVRYQIEGSSKWGHAKLLSKGKHFTGWTIDFKNDKTSGKRVLFYAVDIAGLKSGITSIRFKRSTGSPAATTGTGTGTGTGTTTTPTTNGTITGDVPTGSPTPPAGSTPPPTTTAKSTVSIAAEISQATEGASATTSRPTAIAAIAGRYRISRTSPITAALTVQVSLSSTSTADTTDYSLSTAVDPTVTIPAGSDSVLITLTPTTDTVTPETDETVTLTLRESTDSYALGSSTSATVTIKNTPPQTP